VIRRSQAARVANPNLAVSASAFDTIDIASPQSECFASVVRQSARYQANTPAARRARVGRTARFFRGNCALARRQGDLLELCTGEGCLRRQCHRGPRDNIVARAAYGDGSWTCRPSMGTEKCAYPAIVGTNQRDWQWFQVTARVDHWDFGPVICLNGIGGD